MTFIVGAAKIIGTRRCWARGASSLDRSPASTGKLSAFARLFWRLWMNMLSPRTSVPQFFEAIGVKSLRLPSSSGEESLDSEIISDAGHQHESTPTMVNVDNSSWCTNCHRIPPAAASATRTSSAMTKEHKYFTMCMCIYGCAPGTQRQHHEPKCMCVARR